MAADDHSREYLLSKESFEDIQLEIDSRPRRQRNHITWISATAALAATFVLGIFLGSHPFLINRSNAFTRFVAHDSPLLDHVDLSYRTQTFNGSLFKNNIYRQPASPTVDAAWDALGVNYRSVALTPDEARTAGIRPDQVKINPKYSNVKSDHGGAGDLSSLTDGGVYPANVEGLHQLHCLNLVRQALYFNIDYYKSQGTGAFINSDTVVQAHVTHCLDIIRQQLMCTVDLGFLGQVWWDPNYPKAFVDFNTQHTCRNFEAVRDWAEKHQLPKDVPSDFLQPPEEGDMIYPEIP